MIYEIASASRAENIVDTNTTHEVSRAVYVGVSDNYRLYIGGAWITFYGMLAGSVYPIKASGATTTGAAATDSGDIIFLS